MPAGSPGIGDWKPKIHPSPQKRPLCCPWPESIGPVKTTTALGGNHCFVLSEKKKQNKKPQNGKKLRSVTPLHSSCDLRSYFHGLQPYEDPDSSSSAPVSHVLALRLCRAFPPHAHSSRSPGRGHDHATQPIPDSARQPLSRGAPVLSFATSRMGTGRACWLREC